MSSVLICPKRVEKDERKTNLSFNVHIKRQNKAKTVSLVSLFKFLFTRAKTVNQRMGKFEMYAAD